MSLLVFLLACGVGALLGLVARPAGWFGKLAGVGGLLVAFVAALLIKSSTSLTVGDVVLVGSTYSGLFLACAAASGLLICVVALAAGWPDELAPAALASFAGLAVALTATDSGVALSAGAAATTAGALVIARAAPKNDGPDGRLAEIRTIGLVMAAFMFAGIAVTRPPWSSPGDSPVLVLVFVGVAVALAVRSGAVPFHVPAAHLGRTAQAFAPALLLVWMPAGLGLLALSWSATVFGNGNEWLNHAVAMVQLIAIATIVLGGLAALVHDELEEVVAYSIVADAGFVLLALAARTDAAAAPARLWLLVFVAAKTGLIVWAAAVSHAFGTSNLAALRGWVRRTPVLGVALVVIVAATVGWPGGAVYEARSTIVRLALPGGLQLLFLASIVLSIASGGRLLLLGILEPAAGVAAARGERPLWGHAAVGSAEAATDAAPAEAGVIVATEPAAATTETAAVIAPVTDATLPTVTVAAESTTRTRRRGSQAAAVESPTLVAAVTEETSVGAAAPQPASTPEIALEPAEAPKGPSPWGPRLAATWRLNRTLEVSLVVIAGTVLAAILAFGGFGAKSASQSGIPLDNAAHATSTPTPVPPPAGPTPTPQPTPAPFPSGSALPSGSAAPTPVPTPIKTSGPANGDTG